MFSFVLYTFLLAVQEVFCFILARPRTFLSYKKHNYVRAPQMNYDSFPLPGFLLGSVGLILYCFAPCVGVYADAKWV